MNPPQVYMSYLTNHCNFTIMIKLGKLCSKLGKEYAKVVYYHPGYLTYMKLNHTKCWDG